VIRLARDGFGRNDRRFADNACAGPSTRTGNSPIASAALSGWPAIGNGREPCLLGYADTAVPDFMIALTAKG
ncbi:MAG: hypothetical protein OXF07_08680, partial [Rhodobacter sp.]|nr:hypothetical protein [Rhodobacter sp.]